MDSKCKVLITSTIVLLSLSLIVGKSLTRSSKRISGRSYDNDTDYSTESEGKGKEKGKGKWCYHSPTCNQSSPTSAWQKGDCKKGKRQSPIQIVTTNLIKLNGKLGKQNIQMTDDDLRKYELNKFQVTNTGAMVMIDAMEGVNGVPSFTWPDTIDGLYSLYQVHIHWGANSTWGSEHKIDDKVYSAEVQLVHYRAKSEGADDAGFGSYQEAVDSNEPDALAIISLFLQGDRNFKGKSILEPIIANLANLQGKDSNTTISSVLKLTDMLQKQGNAYTYLGSLTTPPCSQVAAWVVCPEPLKVKEDDLETLRNGIKENPDGPSGNIRRQQKVEVNDKQGKPFKAVKTIVLRNSKKTES